VGEIADDCYLYECYASTKKAEKLRQLPPSG